MIDQLGASPLFLGVESQNWQLADFQVAARNAKALGCSSLLVKIADGANAWYGGLGGWQTVISTVAQIIPAVPYVYSYGNTFGALQAEVNILSTAMHTCGIVIADMESQWNGQVTWGEYVATALKPVSGIFGVTSWADPQEQAWGGVLQALSPCVDFWMPQVYSNNLAGMYQAQYDPYKLPYFPVLNLGTDFGDNDPVQIAKDAHSPIVAFWEYQPAVGAWETIVKYIVALMQPQQEEATVLQIDQAKSFFTETAKDQKWHCIQTGCDVIFGILNFYRSFGQVGLNGISIYGLPRTNEIRYPGKQRATYQIFERGAIMYDPGREVDGVPGLVGDCYPAHIDAGAVYNRLVAASQQQPANISQAVQSLNAMVALGNQLKTDGDSIINTAQAAQKALSQ